MLRRNSEPFKRKSLRLKAASHCRFSERCGNHVVTLMSEGSPTLDTDPPIFGEAFTQLRHETIDGRRIELGPFNVRRMSAAFDDMKRATRHLCGQNFRMGTRRKSILPPPNCKRWGRDVREFVHQFVSRFLKVSRRTDNTLELFPKCLATWPIGDKRNSPCCEFHQANNSTAADGVPYGPQAGGPWPHRNLAHQIKKWRVQVEDSFTPNSCGCGQYKTMNAPWRCMCNVKRDTTAEAPSVQTDAGQIERVQC